MEQHVGPQLERVGEPVGRHVPGFCQVPDNLRVILRIEFEERRIMRRDRVQERKGCVGVAIVIAGLDENGKFERAAAPGRRVGLRRALRCAQCGQEKGSQGCQPPPGSPVQDEPSNIGLLVTSPHPREESEAAHGAVRG